MIKMSKHALVGIAAVTAVAIGTAILIGTNSGSDQPSVNPSTAIPATSPATTPTAKVGGPITKILVFIEENHSLSQMKTGMPYSYSLAKRYGYASNFAAIQHPSLPNYIALAAGDTFSINDDKTPSGHILNATTVFGQAIAAGKTAKTYADGMPANCHLANGGDHYVPRHNPWTYFVNERDLCDAFDVPFAPHFAADAAAGALPNVGMVIPNTCNDAHDCSLATADKWFKARMKTVFASADWKSGRLVVVLTADEDDKKSGNKVLTVVIHPSQKGNVVTTPLTMYSLSQLISNVSHTTPLLKASKAPSMRSAFQLPID